MATAFKVEGFAELAANLDELPKATQRGVLVRTLTKEGQPVADTASRMAPERSGRLSFSIVVSQQLTARQRREPKVSWVEVHIGPAGGLGSLAYASFIEFGTVLMPAQPYMRPAWEAHKASVLTGIKFTLGAEIERSAARLARKRARAAAG